MAEFNVEIRNIEQIRSAFRDSPAIVRPILQQAIDSVPAILASYTIPGIVPYRTGQLIQTFKADVQQLKARWFPTVKYAPMVEFGTGPHTIVPKSLGYKGHPGGLKTPYGIFNKVEHPGTKPNRYMERIRDSSTEAINARFEEALNVIGRKLLNQ